MNISYVLEYDEELFTTLFDTTNKIYLERIFIKLQYKLHSNKEMKNICSKIESKIKTFKTENMISNNVSLVYYYTINIVINLFNKSVDDTDHYKCIFITDHSWSRKRWH